MTLTNKSKTLQGLIWLGLSLLGLCFPLLANTPANNQSTLELIKSPPVSSRCLGLLNIRKKYLQARQRSYAVVKKASQLEKELPKNKANDKMAMKYAGEEGSHEIEFLDDKIKNIERLIVLRGCPRVRL